MLRITETAVLAVENPIVSDPEKPITEAAISDIRVSDVRAIYPVMCAINSDKITRNYTFYPRETLVGKKDIDNPSGYSGFVIPTGKPVLREHRLSDSRSMFGGGKEADVPMGRVIYSAYKSAKKDDPQTPHKNKLFPGTVEGNGWLMLVSGITEPEAIHRVLGGAYHTISIGSNVEKVIESISGTDLVAAYKNGEELPLYSKGQIYKVDNQDRLSYLSMYGLHPEEVSYVNSPSDNRAFNKEKDIGEEGLRILLGEKKQGSQEFNFYDVKTLEKVEKFLPDEDWAVDETFSFVDSASVPTFFRIEKPAFTETHDELGLEITMLEEKIDKLTGLLSESLKKTEETPIVIKEGEGEAPEPIIIPTEGEPELTPSGEGGNEETPETILGKIFAEVID